MLTKTKVALAAALIFGAASAAQANEPRDEFGGYRVGPLGQSFQGANPVYYRSLRRGGLAYDFVAPSLDNGIGDCPARFRSYDPVSGTYLGFDGKRHQCR